MIHISELPTIENLVNKMRIIKVKMPIKKEVLDKELHFLKVRGATYSEEGIVDVNDIVTLSVSSEIPKFNKESLEVVVGKNYYDEKLEKSIIGIKKKYKENNQD